MVGLARTIKRMFTTGVNGAWYDPSDINLTWRRNLLTYTEQFDNAVWTKYSATITANVSLAPNGALTADLLLETAVNSQHYVLQTVATNASSATLSFYVKPAGRTKVRIRSENPQTGVLSNDFTLAGAGSVANPSTGSITQVENGFYLCTVKSTTNGTGASGYHLIQPLDDSGNDTYVGDISKGIYIWGAQLELGSTATPYQRITDGIKDYLDYKPLPILYQDAAGTTPVTAVGQPVGLMLDKSKGLVLGSELVTNGDFSNGTTGWAINTNGTATVSSGVLTLTNGSFGFQRITRGFATTVGKTYIINCTNLSGNSRYSVSSANDYGQNVLAVQSVSGAVFTATTTTSYIVLSCYTATNGDTATFDNISVRELPGNHAFNPSGNSANFPVLSARYNLLTKTEQFDDAVWTKTASGTGVVPAIAYGVLAPNGTNTAIQVVFDTGLGTTSGDQSDLGYYAAGGAVTGVSYKSGVFVKGAVGAQILIRQQGAAGYVKHTLTGGWDYLTQNETSVLNTVNLNICLRQAVNGTINSRITVSIWHPDLRVANDALNQPAYQRVNTATDYDTVGFKPYLSFNGVNQWLQTNSIDFTYGDKMFVCAGVRKLSDGSIAIPVELSVDATLNNGAFFISAPRRSSGINDYAFDSAGTTRAVTISSGGYVAPITNVISGIGSISAPSVTLRVNGTQVSQSTSTQGSGNYGAYPLYIGARAGSSVWFNGRLYGLVVAGKQASASEIASTEAWLNQKTGAY